MKKRRQQKILEVISSKRIATQQELAEELARRGVEATQSSVSRDIVELELTKINGYYAAATHALSAQGPLVKVDTAGDNLIVVMTIVGQAQPVALAIDNANITEIVGTVAGDDTILVAVKNRAAQRLAMKKIIALFTRASRKSARKPARATSAKVRAFTLF